MQYTWALAVLVPLALAWLLSPARRVPKGARMAPGPFCLPGLGSPSLILNKHRRLDSMLGELRKFGDTLTTGMPGMGVVVTTNPANVEWVLKTNFANYEKGDHFKTRFEPLLGNGIFNADGHLWKVQRKTASHMFSTRILREDMTPVFVQHGNSVVAHLDKLAASGEVFDLQDLFYRFTLDSIGELAFGINVDSLHNDTPFSKAFDRANGACTERFLTPLWRLKKLLGVGSEAQLVQDIAVLDAFAYKTIAERKADPGLADRKDVLSRFLRLRDEETGEPFSERFLRDIVMNYLIAGRDTTAQCLSWMTYELAQAPEAADRVAAEAARLCPSGDPDHATAAEMEFAQAVVDETLRLHPSVPMDSKNALADDVLPDKTFVPKGYNVLYAPWHMGRATELWGADAEEFKPERWLGQEPVSPFKFTAFQAGPRTCLGVTMAPLEMKLLMCLMHRRFRFEMVPGQNITYDLTATLQMKYGLKMKVSRR